MTTLNRQQIIAHRKLLQQNAPKIYQLFVAKKLYRPKVVDEVSKAVQVGIQPQSVVETNQ